MNRVMGTCSQCGGPVIKGKSTPTSCSRCGSKPKAEYGPVIETEKPTPSPRLLLES